MAVTSLWRVKGWLGKVVIYIENRYCGRAAAENHRRADEKDEMPG